MTKHVQVPTIKDLKQLNLKPKDLLVYAAIAKFKNSKTNEAYPSIATISKEIGFTAPTIIKSIKALESAKLLSKESREGESTIYKFAQYDKFEMFSEDFLNNTDLSAMEKAYIISITSKLIKSPEERIASTSYTTKQLSNELNMSRSEIMNQDKSLVEKGMMSLVKIDKKDSETGLQINQKIFYPDNFANSVIFELGTQKAQIGSLEKSDEIQNRRINEQEERMKKLEFVLKMHGLDPDKEYNKYKTAIVIE